MGALWPDSPHISFRLENGGNELSQWFTTLTLPAIHDGGSWFNKGACPMNTTTHTVEVPFPQAFTGLASRLFPSAPRYRPVGEKRDIRPRGWEERPCFQRVYARLSHWFFGSHVSAFTRRNDLLR